MCLGVPGRVVEWVDHDPTFATAKIEFGGISRICSMACVPDAVIDDYVVVHAGIAISRIDKAAAMATLLDLQDAGLAQEIADLRRDPLQNEGDGS